MTRVLDPDKLMRFAIPAGEQLLTPQTVALYALSIGMNHDPLDTRQLAFTDPLRGPKVMPAMVLVMAHPGFWLANPRSGVDPAAVLHGAQGFEIVGPLPQTGLVRSETRITDLVDKGEGKAALILAETWLTDAAGTRFARLERTTFVRGGGGFGGSATPRAAPRDAASLGHSTARPDGVFSPASPGPPPDRVVDLQTSRQQALLYRLNGDLNPLHSDPAVAAAAGFSAPILHGLCTAGMIAHALLRGLADYDPARLAAMSLRFCNPVLPGDTLRTYIWADGRFGTAALERDCLVADQGRAVIATVAQPQPRLETSL